MLKMMARAKPAVLKAMLNGASPDLVKALCECSMNVLRGNVKLSSHQKKRLSRYKQGMRALSRGNTSMKRKKQILQKGGFVGALLKPVLGVLGGLLGI